MKHIKILLLFAIGLVMSSFFQPDQDDYMSIYIQYVKSDETLSAMDAYPRYTLVYIDDDTIPEMILQGESNAEGFCVLALHNGVVSKLYTSSTNLYFIEKSGLLNNRHCYFGNCGEEVYQLKNGEFVLMATWSSVDMSMAVNFFGGDEDDEEETKVEEEIKYYFNDNEMDETAAQQLLNQAFYLKGNVIDVEGDLEWFEKEELLKRND